MLVLINQGELCINEAERIKAWIEHYTGQLNVAFPWNESSLPKAPPAVGPTRPITDKMTKVALDQVKSDKEAAPSGISFEMSKAAGDTDITFLCNLIKYVMIQGEILED